MVIVRPVGSDGDTAQLLNVAPLSATDADLLPDVPTVNVVVAGENETVGAAALMVSV